MPISVLIVDDEHLARKRMRRFIEAEPDLQLVGESAEGADALRKIIELNPQLTFLDIRLPGMSGLELSRILSRDRSPYIIFTTACSKYALDAFRVAAVDYLLKPFEQERFRRALDKVRSQLNKSPVDGSQQGMGTLLAQVAELSAGLPRGARKKLSLHDGIKCKLIDLDDIAFLKADGDYLQVSKIGGEKTLIRERITKVEERINDRGFVRISRFVLLNLEQVRELKPYQRGDYRFTMKSGEVFTSGPTYRPIIRALLASMK